MTLLVSLLGTDVLGFFLMLSSGEGGAGSTEVRCVSSEFVSLLE